MKIDALALLALTSYASAVAISKPLSVDDKPTTTLNAKAPQADMGYTAYTSQPLPTPPPSYNTTEDLDTSYNDTEDLDTSYDNSEELDTSHNTIEGLDLVKKWKLPLPAPWGNKPKPSNEQKFKCGECDSPNSSSNKKTSWISCTDHMYIEQCVRGYPLNVDWKNTPQPPKVPYHEPEMWTSCVAKPIGTTTLYGFPYSHGQMASTLAPIATKTVYPAGTNPTPCSYAGSLDRLYGKCSEDRWE